MTVDELITALQTLSDLGYGNMIVALYYADHDQLEPIEPPRLKVADKEQYEGATIKAGQTVVLLDFDMSDFFPNGKEFPMVNGWCIVGRRPLPGDLGDIPTNAKGDASGKVLPETMQPWVLPPFKTVADIVGKVMDHPTRKAWPPPPTLSYPVRAENTADLAIWKALHTIADMLIQEADADVAYDTMRKVIRKITRAYWK